MLLLFREQAVLPVDGMVEPEDYDLGINRSKPPFTKTTLIRLFNLDRHLASNAFT